MCFYLNILYIKACTTIKILIKRFENLMHLNCICCLLHKYFSFLLGELLYADRKTYNHFSTMPEGADLCFIVWRKGKHDRIGR
jgi:hypothetical protein